MLFFSAFTLCLMPSQKLCAWAEGTRVSLGLSVSDGKDGGCLLVPTAALPLAFLHCQPDL